MPLNFGLQDTHVLISGSSGGIGIEIIKTFQQLGAKITAHYNSKPGSLSGLQDITTVQADVRDESSVENLFQQAIQHNGPVSVLVVNHGISPAEHPGLVDMDLSRWQNTLDVNLTGSFLLTRAFLKQLRGAPALVQESANVVFVGSTAGKFGEAGNADYAASKSALMYGLTMSLKNEIVAIAPKARVNCVNPGWTATYKKEAMMAQSALMEKIYATIPLKKIAEPKDVAAQIAVLASPKLSGHVNGTNVFVDGGMEGRLLFPPKTE